MEFKVITFYRYIDISNVNYLIEKVKEKCRELNLFGRVFLGLEGINAGISGNKDRIIEFKDWIKKIKEFEDLTFREQDVKENVYHKLVVRLRKDIVNFGIEVDLNSTGIKIKPEKLKEWLDNNEDLVLLDARNNYEVKVGKFKNAIDLDIDNFRDFNKSINKIEKFKNKKIVMYCTGGIRCEKASAYLKENNFKDIYQLEGGIINFINTLPDSYFEGSCFVFDDRKISNVNGIISKCEICNCKSSEYINCFNLDCDKLFVCCDNCKIKMNSCCSLKCMKSKRKRELKPFFKQLQKKEMFAKEKIVGKVLNYYRKNNVALVEVNNKINKGIKIKILGNTTNIEQDVKELRDYDGNIIEDCNKGLITLPVDDKVRKNDEIISI